MEPENKTQALYSEQNEAEQISTERIPPHLFVCNDNVITDYELKGRMKVGRPIPGEIPDIPIDNPHVSHRHGVFETDETGTIYITEKTTNGVTRDGVELWPGGHTFLRDGDELVIPAATPGSNGADILLVYIESAGRLNIWQELQRAAGKKTEKGETSTGGSNAE